MMVVTGPGVEYHTRCGASGFVIRAVFAQEIKKSNRRVFESYSSNAMRAMTRRKNFETRLSSRGALRARSMRK